MNLRDQLKEILPDILPRNPNQSIKGTELIELVKYKLKQDEAECFFLKQDELFRILKGDDPIKVEFVSAEPPFEELKDPTVGTQFRIKVVFENDPGRDSEPVSVRNKRTGQTLTLIAKQTADPKIFRTAPVNVIEDLVP